MSEDIFCDSAEQYSKMYFTPIYSVWTCQFISESEWSFWTKSSDNESVVDVDTSSSIDGDISIDMIIEDLSSEQLEMYPLPL